MKKILLSIILSLQVLLMTHAAAPPNGIVVYAEGQQTCYLFSQMPTVTYSYDDKVVVAELLLEGIETPVVSLKLEGDSKLKIEYGEVEESSVNIAVSSRQKSDNKGKYIVCGRLIIVKDGKLYDSNGTKVK